MRFMKQLVPFLLLMGFLSVACDKDEEPDEPDTTNTTDTTTKDTSKTDMYEIAIIKTSFGDMVCWLYDETPKHKANFLKLGKEGFYDGTTFHRIIDNFMIQGGDPNSKDENPNNDGQGGPGYTIEAEINSDLKHIHGALSSARLGDNVNPQKASSGSQFFIVENENGYSGLDGGYTVFGRVLKGLDVVSTIAVQPKGVNDRPTTDIKMDVDIETISKADLKAKYNFEP